MGTYAVSGNMLTTTKEIDSGTHTGDPAPFCVSGNMLKVRGGDDTLIIATKN
jgi:hypothetical protein